ncbi:protein furry [Anaeramoeba ignava]|uniref:Protein furry n=1 Tax=Anaeramoeba ignava TaxID=1746090 RepID=A0A9Q0LC37_ANAIG|nr:protein furry [Anaeramoeba ignava]
MDVRESSHYIIQSIFTQFTSIAKSLIQNLSKMNKERKPYYTTIQNHLEFQRCIDSLSNLGKNCIENIMTGIITWREEILGTPNETNETNDKKKLKKPKTKLHTVDISFLNNLGIGNSKLSQIIVITETIFSVASLRVLKYTQQTLSNKLLDKIIKVPLSQLIDFESEQQQITEPKDLIDQQKLNELCEELIGELSKQNIKSVVKIFFTGQETKTITPTMAQIQHIKLTNKDQVTVDFNAHFVESFLNVLKKLDRRSKRKLARCGAKIFQKFIDNNYFRDFDFTDWFLNIRNLYNMTAQLGEKASELQHYLPLQTALLCCSDKAFFFEKHKEFIELSLKSLKNKSIRFVSLECVSNFLRFYMTKFVDPNPERVAKNIEKIALTIFSFNRKMTFNVFSPSISATPDEMILFISDWKLSYAMNFIIFKLIESDNSEWVLIGVRTFFALLEKNPQKQSNRRISDPTTLESFVQTCQEKLEKVFTYYDNQVGNFIQSAPQLKSPIEPILKEKSKEIDILIYAIKSIPRVLPFPNKLLEMISKYTIHFDQNLSSISFEAMKRIIANQSEIRLDLLNAFGKFILQIPDNFVSIIQSSLQKLLELILLWVNILKQSKPNTFLHLNSQEFSNNSSQLILSKIYEKKPVFRNDEETIDSSHKESIDSLSQSQFPQINSQNDIDNENIRQIEKQSDNDGNDQILENFKNGMDDQIQMNIKEKSSSKNLNKILDFTSFFPEVSRLESVLLVFLSSTDPKVRRYSLQNLENIRKLVTCHQTIYPEFFQQESLTAKINSVRVIQIFEESRSRVTQNIYHPNKLMTREELLKPKRFLSQNHNLEEFICGSKTQDKFKWTIYLCQLLKRLTISKQHICSLTFKEIFSRLKSINDAISSKIQQRKKLGLITKQIEKFICYSMIAASIAHPSYVSIEDCKLFFRILSPFFLHKTEMLCNGFSQSNEKIFPNLISGFDPLIQQILNEKEKKGKKHKNRELTHICIIYRTFADLLEQESFEDTPFFQTHFLKIIQKISSYVDSPALVDSTDILILRYHLALFVSRYSSLMELSDRLIDRNDRRFLWKLFAKYCGLGDQTVINQMKAKLTLFLREHHRDPQQKESIRKNFEEQSVSVQFACLKAMSSLLYGEFFDDQINQVVDTVFTHIFELLHSQNKSIQSIGTISMRKFLTRNLGKLFPIYFEQSYSIDTKKASAFTISLVEAFIRDEVDVSISEALVLVLYKLGYYDQLIRKSISDLLKYLSIKLNKSGQNLPVILSQFYTIQENYRDSQFKLSALLASRYPELAYRMFGEFSKRYWQVNRQIKVDPTKIHLIEENKSILLRLLTPWLKKMVCNNEDEVIAKNFTEVLESLFKITSRDSNKHSILIQKTWGAITYHSSNLGICFRFLVYKGIILSQISKNDFRSFWVFMKQISVYIYRESGSKIVQYFFKKLQLLTHKKKFLQQQELDQNFIAEKSPQIQEKKLDNKQNLTNGEKTNKNDKIIKTEDEQNEKENENEKNEKNENEKEKNENENENEK